MINVKNIYYIVFVRQMALLRWAHVWWFAPESTFIKKYYVRVERKPFAAGINNYAVNKTEVNK